MIKLTGKTHSCYTSMIIWILMGMHMVVLAQENNQTLEATRQINELQLKHNLPSLSVAVLKDDEIVFSHAAGFSDLELAVPASVETKYRVGSISKSITAVLTLILVQKELIDLYRPIQNYCPNFPEKRYPLNIEQLLTHQAGIRHYDFSNIEQEYFSNTRYHSSSDAIQIFKNDTLISKPGSKHHYSSYGYSLVGCAIENVTQSSFEQALKNYILDPAEMKNTVLDYPERVIGNRTKPYDLSVSGNIKNSRSVDLSNKFPGGGILSTPSDLVRFGNAVLRYKLLSKKNVQMLWEEQKTAQGESTNYALGWRTSEDKDYVFHGGSSAGGKSMLLILPQENLVVAFTTNVSKFPVSRLEFAQQMATLFSK